MIQFDASSLDPLAIVFLLVAAVLVNLLTGALTSIGWRDSVAKDIELYKKMIEAARTDEDRQVAESLRRSAFKRAARGATGVTRAGNAFMTLFARFPLTIIMAFVVTCEVIVFGRFIEAMLPLVIVPLAADLLMLVWNRRSDKGKDGPAAGSGDGREGEVDGGDEDDVGD